MTQIILDTIFILLTLGLIAAAGIFVYYKEKLGVGASPSSSAAHKAMIEEIKSLIESKTLPAQPTIIDMGSGTGALCMALARALPGAKIIGLELNWPALKIAQARAVLKGQKNLSYACEDFYTADLTNADVIVTYLVGDMLARLEPKLTADLPPHARVLCLNYRLPDGAWSVYKEYDIKGVFETGLYGHQRKNSL